MAVRHRHKVGDYLVKSDQSGRIFYASEMRKQWNGLLVHKSEFERRHPQDFVRPRRDPEPLREVRIRAAVTAYTSAAAFFVGSTQVAAPQDGAASHLFGFTIGDGVGFWTIETDFEVQ